MYNDWVEDSEDQTSESENWSFASRCLDEVGRAVGDAARQEAARAFDDEENRLIDAYVEALPEPNSGNDALQDYLIQLMLLNRQNKKRSGLTDCEDTSIMLRIQQRRNEREQVNQELREAAARREDGLRRTVSDNARAEAARAFIDEENALVEEERSQIERWYEYRLQNLGVPSSFARCPDELGRAVGDAATALESSHNGDMQPGIVTGAGAVATGAPDGPHGDNDALRTRQLDSKPDLLRDSERMIERCETLQRDQDSVNNVHEFYIRELAEQLRALRDDYDELADELAEARDESEQISRMLEQNDRQASLAHPYKPASVASRYQQGLRFYLL